MAEAFEDDDLVPISALQHFAFCERQCGLIHIERLWKDNELTAEGRLIHERVDVPRASGSGRIAFGVPLRSHRLGLIGRADVVEFTAPIKSGLPEVPLPVEYKRGRSGVRLADRAQLCAQAMALEEMMGVNVPRGALFYHSSRRRVVVECDLDLRAVTEFLAIRVGEMLRSGKVPKAVLEPKCRRCSLRSECQPLPHGEGDPERYLRDLVHGAGGSTGE